MAELKRKTLTPRKGGSKVVEPENKAVTTETKPKGKADAN